MPNVADVLLHGTVLSFLCSLLVLVSLYVNPRLWLQDYPKSIRGKAPAKTQAERRQSLLFGVPFLLLLFAVPVYSTLTLQWQNGGNVPFLALFASAFGVMFIFNLVDWLLLDWLIFCVITPRFVMIPGTEGMATYKDFAFHCRGFLIGTVFSAVGGLSVAALVSFL